MKTLKFTDNKLRYQFAFGTDNEFLQLEKIVFEDFMNDDPNEWSRKIIALNPMLSLSFHKPNGFRGKPIILIDSLISPMHFKPILHFHNFQKIYNNVDLEDNWPGTYHELTIEMKYTPQNDLKLNATLFYETSNDVALFKPQLIMA